MLADYLTSFSDKLMICSYCLTTSEPVVFKSSDNIDIIDAIIASSSAPSYFNYHVINNKSYVDGGLCMNNPSLLGILKGRRDLVTITKRKRKKMTDTLLPMKTRFLLFNFGTGYFTKGHMITNNAFHQLLSQDLIEMTMGGSQRLVAKMCTRLQSFRNNDHPLNQFVYHQMDIELEERVDLDDSYIVRYCDDHKEDLENVVRNLNLGALKRNLSSMIHALPDNEILVRLLRSTETNLFS